jgi:hypothetical protein
MTRQRRGRARPIGQRRVRRPSRRAGRCRVRIGTSTVVGGLDLGRVEVEPRDGAVGGGAEAKRGDRRGPELLHALRLRNGFHIDSRAATSGVGEAFDGVSQSQSTDT